MNAVFLTYLTLSWKLPGGDSKTLMFVQISPNEADVGETLCSLNFASRVRGVELGPAKKHLDSGELFKYKQLVYAYPVFYVCTQLTYYPYECFHSDFELLRMLMFENQH